VIETDSSDKQHIDNQLKQHYRFAHLAANNKASGRTRPD
jgi:hypothetical protein